MSIAADARDRREPGSWGPLKAVGLAVLLFSLRVLVPPLALLSVVAGFPIAIQRLRSSAAAIVTALSAALLIGALYGSFELALEFVLVLALPSLIIGEVMARGRGLRRGCVLAALFLGAEILLLLLAYGPEMGQYLVHSVEGIAANNLAGLKGLLPPDELESQAEMWRNVGSAVAVVYPAVYLILAALMVGANAVLLRGFLARTDPGWLDGEEFEGIRLPFAISLVFVLAGLGVLVPALQPVSYNVLLLCAFLFALQGFAVVIYYAYRLAVPPLLRIGLVALIFLSPLRAELFGLLGLFDLWFDFRRFADTPAGPK